MSERIKKKKLRIPYVSCCVLRKYVILKMYFLYDISKYIKTLTLLYYILRSDEKCNKFY